jgi:plastocyanin
MSDDFRQRVFLPILMPVAVTAAFIAFAFALSRVLLAVPEAASTTIALGLAAYILGVAAIIAAKPRITSRALAVGVTIGVVAILGSGMLAAAAGMREIEGHGAEEVAGAGGEAPGEQEGAGDSTGGQDVPGEGLTWVAIDINFSDAPATAPAGEQTIVLDNQGVSVHNVTFEEAGDTPVVEAQGGATEEGSFTFEAGATYTYFCSVPGHETLMRGELTVE